MINTIRLDNAIASLHDLDAGAVLSTAGTRGTVIRCLQGQAWVTQEGDTQDYFLAAGTRFQATRSGSIVVNALVESTQIAVARSEPTPKADWIRNAVRLEPGFVEAAHRQARIARAHFLAALLSGAWRGVRRRLQHLVELVSRGALSMRGRRGYHQ